MKVVLKGTNSRADGIGFVLRHIHSHVHTQREPENRGTYTHTCTHREPENRGTYTHTCTHTGSPRTVD